MSRWRILFVSLCREAEIKMEEEWAIFNGLWISGLEWECHGEPMDVYPKFSTTSRHPSHEDPIQDWRMTLHFIFISYFPGKRISVPLLLKSGRRNRVGQKKVLKIPPAFSNSSFWSVSRVSFYYEWSIRTHQSSDLEYKWTYYYQGQSLHFLQPKFHVKGQS